MKRWKSDDVERMGWCATRLMNDSRNFLRLSTMSDLSSALVTASHARVSKLEKKSVALRRLTETKRLLLGHRRHNHHRMRAREHVAERDKV